MATMDAKISALLGNTVTYIRQTGAGEIIEGTGICKGIGLDPDQRVIVLVKDGDNAFNTFLSCINPDDIFKQKFKRMCAQTNDMGEKGNKEAKALVESYNLAIDAKKTETVGAPLVFE